MTIQQSNHTVIEFFSEDIAEIKNAVWNNYYNQETKRMSSRGNELMERLDKIYNSLYMKSTPVLLVDKDGRNMNEFKKSVNQ